MMIPLGDTVYFDLVTRDINGVRDADDLPLFSVFQNVSDDPLLADEEMVQRVSYTGHYRGSFTLDADAGFEVGQWCNVVAAATVGGKDDKTIALTFRIIAAEQHVGQPLVDAELSAAERAAMATAYQDLVDGVETGLTPRQSQRLLVAVLLGKMQLARSGRSETLTFRDFNDSKDRVVAAAGPAGRTSIETDPD